MKIWWDALTLRARAVLLGAALLMVTLLGAGAWWALRGDPAVLFAELRPQDAAALTAELDKLKVPYTLADNGATLLVDRSQVHTVRMKLMGRELPLHGTVGFELFNTSDFGMTEFAQKINYQRALQGELTRTILSFPEVRDARVHLALPEQGLFRQNTARAKAAITLTIRRGQLLRAEQVAGIQRLVAAAVPGLAPQEVTVVDQEGVALTRASDPEGEPGAAGVRLELKRETESYLSRKAQAVLEKAFGPGQALASVDVTLNMDQVKVTTEDVIAAPEGKGGPPTGVLVRERESARDSAAPDAGPGDGRAARGSSMQRDVEYQAGRRVEHVVSQPGAVRRIQVVALVRQELDAEQRQQIHSLVSAAVGASSERGDVVVVQSLRAAAPAARDASLPAPAHGAQVAQPAPDRVVLESMATLALALALALALLAAGVLALASARRARRSRPLPVLTDSQRQAALQRVQAWMLQSEPLPTHEANSRGSAE